MKTLTLFFFLWVGFPALLSGQAGHNLEETARKFFHHLILQETEEMEQMLSAEFLNMVPDGQLEAIASGIEKQLGAFSHIKRSTYQQTGAYEVITLVVQFGNTDWGLNITFDEEHKIAGFHLNVAPPEAFTPPPSYSDSTLFTEKELMIDCGDIKLPALLTMPEGNAEVPAVVLVHGSGPHDKDKTIGPNKIFRDIAYGLASKGIAVLRYEKRTFRNHTTLDNNTLTVWEETGSDALHAIDAAIQQKGIDPNRIYLAGHSLGGMLAPRIAAEEPRLAGIISLAGSPRFLYEIIPQQLQHLQSLSGDTTDAYMNNMIDESIEMGQRLAQKRETPDAVYETSFMNIPPSYWQDLNRHNIGAIAAELPQPILIIHGGRDYQINMEDFQAWKDALQAHPDATFVLLENLDHLFFAGEGPSDPQSYYDENNVDHSVIKTIAGWILR